MKVAIVGIQNLKHMTTASVYTEIFEKYHIDYDIIYIDKYNIEEKSNARKMYKYLADNKYPGVIGKINNALRFYKFATKVIKKEKYDFIVLWREYAVFLFSVFAYKNYKKMYSVNIRDLWDRKNFIITLGIRKAMRGSLFNTVCSDGFIKFLPKGDYIFLHCINYTATSKLRDLLSTKKDVGNSEEKQKINIVYIGTLRFADYCCSIVDIFGNDERFCLKYIGQGCERIKEFAKKKGYMNIDCTSAFPPEDTAKYLLDADIINCAYGAKSNAEKALLPTRFYYAIEKNVPVLTTEGTWVQKKADEMHMGLTIPSIVGDKSKVADTIFKQYKSMDMENIKYYCMIYKNEIAETQKAFENMLVSVLKQKENR